MLRLEKIAEVVSIDEIDRILKVAKGAKLDLNHEAALTQAANDVAQTAKKFSENYDGTTLSAIDSLIPPRDAYRGVPAR